MFGKFLGLSKAIPQGQSLAEKGIAIANGMKNNFHGFMKDIVSSAKAGYQKAEETIRVNAKAGVLATMATASVAGSMMAGGAAEAKLQTSPNIGQKINHTETIKKPTVAKKPEVKKTIQTNPQQIVQVGDNKLTWGNNNTKNIADGNEKKLFQKTNTNGDIVISAKTITDGGSLHGKAALKARSLMQKGELSVLLYTDGFKKAIKLALPKSGELTIPKNSHLYAQCFDAQGIFRGHAIQLSYISDKGVYAIASSWGNGERIVLTKPAQTTVKPTIAKPVTKSPVIQKDVLTQAGKIAVESSIKAGIQANAVKLEKKEVKTIQSMLADAKHREIVRGMKAGMTIGSNAGKSVNVVAKAPVTVNPFLPKEKKNKNEVTMSPLGRNARIAAIVKQSTINIRKELKDQEDEAKRNGMILIGVYGTLALLAAGLVNKLVPDSNKSKEDPITKANRETAKRKREEQAEFFDVDANLVPSVENKIIAMSPIISEPIVIEVEDILAKEKAMAEILDYHSYGNSLYIPLHMFQFILEDKRFSIADRKYWMERAGINADTNENAHIVIAKLNLKKEEAIESTPAIETEPTSAPTEDNQQETESMLTFTTEEELEASFNTSETPVEVPELSKVPTLSDFGSDKISPLSDLLKGEMGETNLYPLNQGSIKSLKPFQLDPMYAQELESMVQANATSIVSSLEVSSLPSATEQLDDDGLFTQAVHYITANADMQVGDYGDLGPVISDEDVEGDTIQPESQVVSEEAPRTGIFASAEILDALKNKLNDISKIAADKFGLMPRGEITEDRGSIIYSAIQNEEEQYQLLDCSIHGKSGTIYVSRENHNAEWKSYSVLRFDDQRPMVQEIQLTGKLTYVKDFLHRQDNKAKVLV